MPNECASCIGTFDRIKSRGTVQACMQVGRLVTVGTARYSLVRHRYSSPIYLLLQKFHVVSSEEYKMFYPIMMTLGYLVPNTRWNYMNVDCFLI